MENRKLKKSVIYGLYVFGFMFLLNPAYISRIDPFAGLLNIFNFNELTNSKKRYDFISKFDFIVCLSNGRLRQ